MRNQIVLAIVTSFSLFAAEPLPKLPVQIQRSLDRITADDLKGDLSFLASDALQGRFTPSPGLEIAAEFIASKFRSAGLQPGGDHEYFQTAEMIERRLPAMSKDLTLLVDGKTISVPASAVRLEASAEAMQLEHALVVFVAGRNVEQLKGLDLKGRVVIAPEPEWQKLTDEQRGDAWRKGQAFDKAVALSDAALNITLTQRTRHADTPRLLFADQAGGGRTPALSVHDEDLSKLLAASKSGVTLSADLPAPADTKVKVKNVIGILRGSDPVLAKTAVLLTAHYDHIGTVETSANLTQHAADESSDRIYNGANDDGSGTVSVIEIARAMAKLRPRPKRSVVFMTFFGEERGELGSKFYGRHPVFPISQTVADVNLEQMGRTDATNGSQLNKASVTGFDYSEVTGFFERAGRRLGIKVYRDAEASDAYFTRSDNDALAEQGVPAHTLCVAFDYSDYHGLGDEWNKINYKNMAKVDRMVLLGLVGLANSAKAPEWNVKNSKTEPFRKAHAASLGTK